MKSHNFLPSQLNVLECATCKRNMLAHLPNAECESCSQLGECEVVNNILMCEQCQKREIEIKDELAARTAEPLSVTHNEVIENSKSPAQHMQELAASIMAELPANGSEFYNARITAIVELEKKIMADDNIPSGEKHYFFAQQIVMRQQELYKGLVKVKELITEIQSEQHANYRTIQALAQRLSAEEREKLSIKYAEYQPASKLPKVVKPRMNLVDKTIEGFAKIMFAGGKKWEELSDIEQRKAFQQAKQYYNMITKECEK